MVLIFANGFVEYGAWLHSLLSQADIIIAANGGARPLLQLDSRPDVIVGDMDSLPMEAESWLADGTEFVRHPPDKDLTDLELALRLASDRYEGQIQVVGAWGGRIDQALANLLLLSLPFLQGRSVSLISRYQRAWLVSGESRITGKPGDKVSLIPIGGDAHIAATTNLKWTLVDEPLIFGASRGVSNQLSSDAATLKVAKGMVFCVTTDRDWSR